MPARRKQLHNRLITRLSATVAITIASCTLSGCYGESGPGFSIDRYTYVSRPWSPKTITVVDTRTGEEIWTVDIPVGKQLVMDFEKGKDPEEYMPDQMHWRVMNAGKRYGDLTSTIPAPPAGARRVDLTLRAVPESVDTILSSGEGPESDEVFMPMEGVTSDPMDPGDN